MSKHAGQRTLVSRWACSEQDFPIMHYLKGELPWILKVHDQALTVLQPYQVLWPPIRLSQLLSMKHGCYLQATCDGSLQLSCIPPTNINANIRKEWKHRRGFFQRLNLFHSVVDSCLGLPSGAYAMEKLVWEFLVSRYFMLLESTSGADNLQTTMFQGLSKLQGSCRITPCSLLWLSNNLRLHIAYTWSHLQELTLWLDCHIPQGRAPPCTLADPARAVRQVLRVTSFFASQSIVAQIGTSVQRCSLSGLHKLPADGYMWGQTKVL